MHEGDKNSCASIIEWIIMAKLNKFDHAKEVAVAMESAGQGALLDVLLNFFCEDTGKH